MCGTVTYCCNWKQNVYKERGKGMLDFPVLDIQEIMPKVMKKGHTCLKIFNGMHLIARNGNFERM